MVRWVTDQISVIPSNCVMDEDMLHNPEKIGILKWGTLHDTEPKGGWEKHEGRVLFCSGKFLCPYLYIFIIVVII